MFYRQSVDNLTVEVPLQHFALAPGGSTCMILGASPSVIDDLSCPSTLQDLRHAPITIFGINLAGLTNQGWFLKPHLWTAYDDCHKFPYEFIWSDPSITKFIRGGRYNQDVGNEVQHHKACEMPNTYVFQDREREDHRTLFSLSDSTVAACQDSLIQAIDIAVKLGYRKLVFFGCSLKVHLSDPQKDYLREMGIDPDCDHDTKTEHGRLYPLMSYSDRLSDIISKAGMKRAGVKVPSKQNSQVILDELQELERESQYLSQTQKSLYKAVETDTHYWNVVQHIRAARSSLREAGVSITVIGQSRLAPYADFVYTDVAEYLHGNFPLQERDLRTNYDANFKPFTVPYEQFIPIPRSPASQVATQQADELGTKVKGLVMRNFDEQS